jgi:type IV pilus assembly protein PilW
MATTTIITLKHSQGFTLTEIMIALLLSLILMAGVLTIMSSSKRTYALQTKLAELQDNARFVMNDLKNDLRMAGYGGCAGGFDPFFSGNNLNNQQIRGDGTSTSFPLSDKMILNFSELLPYEIVASTPDMGISRIRLLSSPASNFITVSNCAVPQNYPVAALVINLQPSLDLPIDVFFPIEMYYEVCYINEEFALFRGVDTDNDKTLCDETEGNKTNGRELVVEGVENMQVRYGIDTDGDNIANRYSVTPPLSPLPQLCGDKTTNRPVVVSVRITLLMRTVGKRSDLDEATDKTFQLDENIKYNPNGKSKSIESGYRHRLFTSTIQIRNCFR